MSGYDFDAYVHSIARRQPRQLPACFTCSQVASSLTVNTMEAVSAVWYLSWEMRPADSPRAVDLCVWHRPGSQTTQTTHGQTDICTHPHTD